ncbi:hypothetical protein [Legionella adelaidensis]|uniref:hypothetical protein n=1 Tax=Legionella adelaidensis TaxID=45056 RepID=UPI001041BBB1|nr:hypothetical protein [Legionella adelaidensis]
MKDLKEIPVVLNPEQKERLSGLYQEAPLHGQDATKQFLYLLNTLSAYPAFRCFQVFLASIAEKWDTTPPSTQIACLTDLKIKLEVLWCTIQENPQLLSQQDASNFNDLQFGLCIAEGYRSAMELFDRIFSVRGVDAFAINQKKNYLSQLVANFLRTRPSDLDVTQGMETHYGAMFYNLICEEFGLLKMQDVYAPDPRRISPDVISQFLQYATEQMTNGHLLVEICVSNFRKKLPHHLQDLTQEEQTELFKHFSSTNSGAKQGYLWALYPDFRSLTFRDSVDKDHVFGLLWTYILLKEGWAEEVSPMAEEQTVYCSQHLIAEIDESMGFEALKPMSAQTFISHMPQFLERIAGIPGHTLSQFSFTDVLAFYQKSLEIYPSSEAVAKSAFFLELLLERNLSPSEQDNLFRVAPLPLRLYLEVIIKKNHSCLLNKLLESCHPFERKQIMAIRLQTPGSIMPEDTLLQFALKHNALDCAVILLQEMETLFPTSSFLVADSKGVTAFLEAIAINSPQSEPIETQFFQRLEAMDTTTREKCLDRAISPFLLASKRGNLRALKEMYRLGGVYGPPTTLNTAALAGQLHCVQYLLPIFLTQSNDALARDALRGGNIACILAIFEKREVNILDERYQSVYWAFGYAHFLGEQKFAQIIDCFQKIKPDFSIPAEKLNELAKTISISARILNILFEKKVCDPFELFSFYLTYKKTAELTPDESMFFSKLLSTFSQEQLIDACPIVRQNQRWVLFSTILERLQQSKLPSKRLEKLITSHAMLENALENNETTLLQKLQEIDPSIHMRHVAWLPAYHRAKRLNNEGMRQLLAGILIIKEDFSDYLAATNALCSNQPIASLPPSFFKTDYDSQENVQTILKWAIENNQKDFIILAANLLKHLTFAHHEKSLFMQFLQMCPLPIDKSIQDTVLFKAAATNCEFLALVLATPYLDINININGQTLLYFYLQRSHNHDDTKAAIHLLLDHPSIDVHFRDAYGNSYVHRLVNGVFPTVAEETYSIASKLLQKGIEVNIPNRQGVTALQLAATNQNLLQAILEQPHASHWFQGNESLILSAVSGRNASCLAMLLQRPYISQECTDWEGRNILHHLALIMHRTSSVSKSHIDFRSLKVVIKEYVTSDILQRLLQAVDRYGDTPLSLLRQATGITDPEVKFLTPAATPSTLGKRTEERGLRFFDSSAAAAGTAKKVVMEASSKTPPPGRTQ